MSANTDSESEQRTVFLTTYHGQYPGDGPDIGGVYANEEKAEAIAEEQSDSGRSREYYSSNVEEMVVR